MSAPISTNKAIYPIFTVVDGEYETVAASQTAQVLGGAGAVGDAIFGVLVIPATTSPGAVTLLDGATSIPIFTGGATSVADLKPCLARKATPLTGKHTKEKVKCLLELLRIGQTKGAMASSNPRASATFLYTQKISKVAAN